MLPRPLAGQVALVAGATRGAGRGIARMLGEAGATVYCTGRSTRDRPATPGRPETIDETAELVTAAGGRGIAVRVDHTIEADVAALFERVKHDHGRLDVLVNNIWWGADPISAADFFAPMWKTDLKMGHEILERSVWTHLVTIRHGLPLMLEHKRGLIVEITDGDSDTYRGAIFYDLPKMAGIRIAYALSHELKRYPKMTAVAITPGYMRSELILEHLGVTEENWQSAVTRDPQFAESETPCFVGRAVAALAADPKAHAKNGKVFASRTLGREYGLTDLDGRRPGDYGSQGDQEIGS